jgi:sigma-B regulation protein RsbU (phosphoserine phosphatase)
MPAANRLKSLYRKLGWPERLLLVFLAAYLVLWFLLPGSLIRITAELALIFTGLLVAIRLVRAGIRKAIWRLRNRLAVAYVFIAVVPVLLIIVLAGLGAYWLTGQIAIVLVNTELERRAEALAGPTMGLVSTPPQFRAERIRWLAPYFRERYPRLELFICDSCRDPNRTQSEESPPHSIRHNPPGRLHRNRAEWRYPETSSISLPAQGWGNIHGVVFKDGHLYIWAHAAGNNTEAVMMAPVTPEFLEGLVPNLGLITFLGPTAERASQRAAESSRQAAGAVPAEGSSAWVPAPVNRFDIEVNWVSGARVALWESPGVAAPWSLGVISRPSAVLHTLFSQRPDAVQGTMLTLLYIVALMLLLAELISVFVGLSLTRTITGAVHNLYEGTQRVTAGDFSHRIEVQGNDQLAELGQSFNRMTGNLERLLKVEKEQERLQSEIEIAREVQNQLYPRTVPSVKDMELTALCHPARMVSGDYYDYMSLQDSRLALAIGDVAGKGISAALLMATVQASLRTQIRACLEAAASATASGQVASYESVATARLVSQLNQQLCAYTSPEKYATFWFGIYDEQTGVLTYTNAGHPPPVLIRNGQALRLETNGMVVGAFAFAEYGESRVDLAGGDLLVCFTDGITEPENEYGEMFGEESLIDVLLKNAWRKPSDIIASVIGAVQQWTNSPELQDDMTLLVAKRL